MAAGMIRLSMDPLHYAHPPAELHAPPERFPPCSHDPPRLPCEGTDVSSPGIGNGEKLIYQQAYHPSIAVRWLGFGIIEAKNLDF